MPNYAMQSEMIKWAIEKGCSLYNFGGILHLEKIMDYINLKLDFVKKVELQIT